MGHCGRDQEDDGCQVPTRLELEESVNCMEFLSSLVFWMLVVNKHPALYSLVFSASTAYNNGNIEVHTIEWEAMSQGGGFDLKSRSCFPFMSIFWMLSPGRSAPLVPVFRPVGLTQEARYAAPSPVPSPDARATSTSSGASNGLGGPSPGGARLRRLSVTSDCFRVALSQRRLPALELWSGHVFHLGGLGTWRIVAFFKKTLGVTWTTFDAKTTMYCSKFQSWSRMKSEPGLGRTKPKKASGTCFDMF